MSNAPPSQNIFIFLGGGISYMENEREYTVKPRVKLYKAI